MLSRLSGLCLAAEGVSFLAPGRINRFAVISMLVCRNNHRSLWKVFIMIENGGNSFSWANENMFFSWLVSLLIDSELNQSSDLTSGEYPPEFQD